MVDMISGTKSRTKDIKTRLYIGSFTTIMHRDRGLNTDHRRLATTRVENTQTSGGE